MHSNVNDRIKPPETDILPLLVVTLDGKHIATFPLTKRCVTIGRSAENDICLDDVGVSRNHAQVITVHGVSVIEDLGSRNGTYVNYKWIRTRQLESGDDVIIAQYRMEFRHQLKTQHMNTDIATLMRKWQRGIQGAAGAPCPACGNQPANQDDTAPAV